MVFTFNNYASNELGKSPLEGLISNLLGGYEQGTKLSYLQPQLAEQLKKSQLQNKWYEPNIKSEIGLRGAHAGLLGEQTRTAHMKNESLPEQLKAQLQASQFKAQQDQMFNEILRQRLSGAHGQMNNQAPEYNPGQGQAPFISKQLQQIMNSGLVEEGNINLNNRPMVKNPITGGYSTVYSMGIGLDNGKEALIPRVSDDGRILSEKEAIEQFKKTKKHLGIYNSKETANKAAEKLHQQQELLYQEPFAQQQPQQFQQPQDFSNAPQPTADDLFNKKFFGQDTFAAKNNAYWNNFYKSSNKNPALEQHRELQDNMALWKSLPVNAKAHMIAIGQGAGFSGDETVHWLASGKPMKDLLFQHGINDESEIEPVYQLTGAAQSQLLQRQFASKEADYLSDFIQKSTGDYARTVAGYSPKLVKDQLSGKNEEQQAKFLAARGLAPELVNLRLVLANAKSTVSAQNQLREKAMLDMKNFRTLVSPTVWTRTQQIMDSELQKMFKHAKTGFGQKISQELSKKDNDPLGIR